MAKLKNNDANLSNEDLALKRKLELCVKRVQGSDSALQCAALEELRQEIQRSMSSMTAIPKALKFLRPHYRTLQAYYETMKDSESKDSLADILSALALTMSAKGERESLKYKILSSEGDIPSWGPAYIRNLAEEIRPEFAICKAAGEYSEEMEFIVLEIAAFHMKHNAEHEAVDLLKEVDLLDTHYLPQCMYEPNCKRTCAYLIAMAKYLDSPNHRDALGVAFQTYLKGKEFANALRIALFLDKFSDVGSVFKKCHDLLEKQQLCYIIARHGVNIELTKTMVVDDDDRKQCQDIINNYKLSEGFLTLACDIEVMDAKLPEDIYKVRFLDGRTNTVDSATQNFADTFVNAFVNAGFGQDKLMNETAAAQSDGSSGNWLFKHKEHRITSAVASLGMISLWDVDTGLAKLDKYIHSNDNYVVAGALIGVGIVNCRVNHNSDPALAISGEYVDKEDPAIRIGAIIGLGISYANTKNEGVLSKLTNVLEDTKAPLDVIAFTSISLGLVFVGSCNKEVSKVIIDALMGLKPSDLRQPLARLLLLGYGLLYLGKQTTPKSLPTEIWNNFGTTLFSCFNAGTASVDQVKVLLGICGLHGRDNTYQGPAVLGIAMIAMGEEVGRDMAIRLLENLLQYGEHTIRRAVPLALGLLNISNPKVTVMDTLARLVRDPDGQVAMAAAISLGLIGAGTNNGRIAGMLRRLHSSHAAGLFCVRIAQGLVHLGKGLLTLNPYHSDHFLLSPAALAGIVIMLHCCLDMKTFFEKYHYVLYYLALAMQPRMLLTVDKNLKPLSVPVRVGQGVDVVGQMGQPKTITGFQTYSTPVLLAAGDRAELVTEKYIPLSPILEGFVILKENPDYKQDK